ncbi:MAG TPA: hypothetical protein DHW64_11755 [Chitinophagaceae bacterium]|nr:hypothetical protein [Chitinophagaceae bacterium]
MFSLLHQFKQSIILQLFTVYLRYLIGSAFIIAAFGMGKMNGTSNLIQSMNKPIEQLLPIQQFFRVMQDSGMYWQFIGWSQIIAGALLLTQRLARLGALIFFGLILNIFIITLSYGFQGTPVVTGLMLLATIYLLVWDLPSFMPLIKNSFHYAPVPLKLADHLFWIILGGVMLASIVILALVHQNTLFQLALLFAEGLVGFILYMGWIRKKATIE